MIYSYIKNPRNEYSLLNAGNFFIRCCVSPSKFWYTDNSICFVFPLDKLQKPWYYRSVFVVLTEQTTNIDNLMLCFTIIDFFEFDRPKYCFMNPGSMFVNRSLASFDSCTPLDAPTYLTAFGDPPKRWPDGQQFPLWKFRRNTTLVCSCLLGLLGAILKNVS